MKCSGERLKAVARNVFVFMGRWTPFYDRYQFRRYFHRNDVRKLHVGGGNRRLPGWLNTDLEPRRLNIYRLDATRRFPFDNDVFDYVYSEHTIEHIDLAGGNMMLREIFRVLKPRGRLRISTPDLAFLLHMFREKRSQLEREYMAVRVAECYPGVGDGHEQNPVLVLNLIVRQYGHTFIYDRPTLKQCLAEAGFAEIEECEIEASDYAALARLENVGRMPDGFLALESQILEARK